MKYAFILFIALTISIPAISLAEDVQVTRAEFCTAIADREPADNPETIPVGLQTAYFFTELLNGKDVAVSHRWFYNNVQIADVALKIGADRWRTWSTKQVWHLTPGTLKVQVVGPDEVVITEKEILIQ